MTESSLKLSVLCLQTLNERVQLCDLALMVTDQLLNEAIL